MPKKNLRRLLLERRKDLSHEVRCSAGSGIQRAFMESDEFAAASVVALYAPIHNEVETGEVFIRALAMDKSVLYPAVTPEGLLFRITPGPAFLRKGAFGIMEPSDECLAAPPSAADLIVVPGVAFDLRGHRLGYGKGYYDKTLHMLEGQGRLVGFCYDFQLVEKIPEEPHDVRLDMVITEQRLVRCRN